MNRHKKFSGAGTQAPIDGFISRGRQIGITPTSSYQPQKPAAPKIIEPLNSGRLSIDGFYSSAAKGGASTLSHQPEIDEAALLDEPIILDENTLPRKKRYFGRAHPKLHLSLKRAGQALAALILIVGVYFVAKIIVTEHHLFRGGGGAPALAANIDINQLKGEGDGRVNILLLGIGGPGHSGPDLTDTIIIASVDPVNDKVDLLSIPRDLWVKIPGNGYQKINAAYSDGKSESRAKTLAGKERDGLNLLDQTIEPVIGIPIHYHVVVDFKAFQQVVNSIGGVDANVSEELSANENFWVEGTNQHYQLYVPPGRQHFDGTKALYFARERHNDSDFVRAQRQRLLLTAIKQKVFSLGTFSNPVKISNLLNSVGDNVYSDFSLNDMTRLYQIIQKVPAGKIASVDLVTPPHDFLTTGNMNGLSVVEPKAGLFNYASITDYIRNTLRDGFLAKEDAKLAVYNATDRVGLANSEATVLKSYGYKVATVGNTASVTDPAQTTVIDLTNGKDKYTRHYLERRFGTSATTRIPSSAGVTPPAGTNFVIILGNDVNVNSGG